MMEYKDAHGKTLKITERFFDAGCASGTDVFANGKLIGWYTKSLQYHNKLACYNAANKHFCLARNKTNAVTKIVDRFVANQLIEIGKAV